MSISTSTSTSAAASTSTFSSLGRLTAVEAKLFLRDPAAPITVLGIPVALLIVLSFIPGIREESDKFAGGDPLSTFIGPMAVAILLAMLALNLFPAVIATYREKGVLRRLAATPVPPSRILIAQLLVNLAAAVLVVAVILGLGSTVVGMALPANPAGFALVTVLGAAALFSVGMLIAALSRTARTASGIGSLAFFPMLALGGVWVPKESLPAFLQGLADVLPLGATLNALRETSAGGNPELRQLIALVVATALFGALSARFFRWE